MEPAFFWSSRVMRTFCPLDFSCFNMVRIWGTVLPSPQMTSGNPFRRLRWWSMRVKPRSSKGRDFNRVKACSTEVFPDLTLLRSKASFWISIDPSFYSVCWQKVKRNEGSFLRLTFVCWFIKLAITFRPDLFQKQMKFRRTDFPWSSWGPWGGKCSISRSCFEGRDSFEAALEIRSFSLVGQAKLQMSLDPSPMWGVFFCFIIDVVLKFFEVSSLFDRSPYKEGVKQCRKRLI